MTRKSESPPGTALGSSEPVSVVVPAYDAAATIGDTLDALAAQTYSAWEAIVVDDGSTDSTAEIARQYAARDPRIRVVTQPNGGESAARNTGIRHARHPWLLFLDADDWISPVHLERLTTELASHRDLDAIHCRSVRVALDGTELMDDFVPPAGDLFPTLARRAAFPVHACLVRKSLVEAVGGFDTGLHKSADWDLWQRVARSGAKFGAVPDVLAFYRIQPASASMDAMQLFVDGLTVLGRGHSPDPRVPNPHPSYANGAPPEAMVSQQFYLLCWCAGLMIGSRRSALPLLDPIRGATSTELYPPAIAQCIFDAAPLPTGQARTAWDVLWPEFRPYVEEFLPVLERRSGTSNLASQALKALKIMVLRSSSTWRPALEEIEADLAAQRRRVEELERDKAAFERDKTALEHINLALDYEKSALDRIKTALEQGNAALVQSNAALERENAAVQEIKTTLQAKVAALEHETAALAAVRASLETDKAALEREKVVLEETTSTLERDQAVLERRQATLEDAKAALEAANSALERDNVSLGQEKATLEREKATLVDEKATLERDKAAVEQARGAIETAHEEQRRLTEVLAAHKVTLEEELHRSGQEVGARNLRIDSLTGELERARLEAHDYEARLRELEARRWVRLGKRLRLIGGVPSAALRSRLEALGARLFFGLQLVRLRADRALGILVGRTQRRRVLATACWSFPIYSQTFVYQELTQLIRARFAVRFVYSNLNRKDPLPQQFEPLWRARRRLTLHHAVCEQSYAYFQARMPARVEALIDMLARASGLTRETVREHYHVRQAFAFARMVEAYRPGYLHSYFFYEGTLFALAASVLLDIPRGVSCYADHMLDDYALKVVALHLRQCGIVIATSDRIKQELLRIEPRTPEARVLVKPNGINTARFPSTPRPEPGDGEPFSIVSVCRIEPKKGLVHLIEAMGLLRDRHIDVKLHHIGGVDSSEASRDYHRQLTETIARLGLNGAVHLEGVKSEAEINAIFRASHVFVAPFVETEGGDKDGIPTALLEGMAAGLPTVATNAGSILEVIDDGVDGVIVPQRDAEALAATLASLFADRGRRDELGAAGASSIRRRFDASHCEQVFHDRLRSVLARSVLRTRDDDGQTAA